MNILPLGLGSPNTFVTYHLSQMLTAYIKCYLESRLHSLSHSEVKGTASSSESQEAEEGRKILRSPVAKSSLEREGERGRGTKRLYAQKCFKIAARRRFRAG